MSVNLLKSVLCWTTAIGLCQIAAAQAAEQSGATGVAPIQIAQAQQSAKSDAGDAKGVEEVVVTGTLLRGVAPAGANVIGISAADIKASGVIDANQLLGQLPQSNFFLFLPKPGVTGGFAGTARVPVSQPDIRGLRLAGIPSGSPTLVLLDGHRVVPQGLEQSAVDVGIIPPGMLDREEIVLDGASAIYGTDAVGGVINYIPRKRFKGGMVDATYGMGIKGYYETSANVTNGWTWDGGGLGLTYSFGKNDNILDRDRPQYALPRNYYEGAHPTGIQCAGAPQVGNGGSIPTTLTAGTAYVMNGPNSFRARTASDFCDNDYGDMFPEQIRHSGFMDFSQDITDRLRFDLTAFYSVRSVHDNVGPFTANLQVRPNNPYYIPLRDSNGVLLPGATAGGTETVGINMGPISGNNFGYVNSRTQIGQVAPSLVYDLGGDWQVKGDFVWGKSDVTVDGKILDADALSNYVCGVATVAGQACASRGGTMTVNNAINPYNLLATTNQALFGQLDYHDIRNGVHEFTQVIVKADGTLFSIPGGKVKAAIGVDWNKTELSKAVTNTVTHLLDPRQFSSVNEKAVYAMVNVPIVGPSNERPGIHSLVFEASGRYDTYAFYGDTFNPKFAVSYEPIDWITVRGNWGTSFRAPDAADRLGALYNTARCIGGSGALPGCTSTVQNVPAPLYTGTSTALNASPNVYLLLGGTVADLKPETSHNWTIGGDIRPPFLEGLTLSGSYYDIKYRNHINIPNPGVALDNMFLYGPTSNFMLCINPNGTLINGGNGCTTAQMNTFFASAGTNGQGIINQVTSAGYKVQYMMDTRVQNIYGYDINGLDLTVKYVHPTNWGSVFTSWNGNFQLKNAFKVFANQPTFQDQLLTGASKFHMTFTAGATYHDFAASATLQHMSGFTPTPSPTNPVVPTQLGVDQFDVVNMSFRWNVNGSRPLTQDLQLTVNVNNLFDADPPLLRTATGQRAGNGDGLRLIGTVGRLIQFGISKKF